MRDHWRRKRQISLGIHWLSFPFLYVTIQPSVDLFIIHRARIMKETVTGCWSKIKEVIRKGWQAARRLVVVEDHKKKGKDVAVRNQDMKETVCDSCGRFLLVTEGHILVQRSRPHPFIFFDLRSPSCWLFSFYLLVVISLWLVDDHPKPIEDGEREITTGWYDR